MKIRLPLFTLLSLVALHLQAAETAALPEPGPEDGGLRMRLVVALRPDTSREGYDVRVDLLNTSERAITLRAGWTHDDAGDLKDYLDAATSIECVPAVQRWMGGVPQGQRKAPQPEQMLKAGEVLSVRWQTEGRHLKSRVTDPNEVQNPQFPFPGLYSVHATLKVITSERTLVLRSNEQLVPVGGSHAMPKATLGQLLHVDIDRKTAVLSLGSLQHIEPGNAFEHLSKGDYWKLTITKVEPDHSIGDLEMKSPARLTPPIRGAEVTLVQNRPIAVGIAHDGALTVAGQPCTTGQLSARRTELGVQQPRPVVIQADAATPIQQVAAVMEACKAAGAKPVTLTTAK